MTPIRRRVAGVLATGIVVGAVLWFFGLTILQAVVVVATVVAVGVTLVAVRDEESLGWPAEPVRTTPGSRKDVQSLGWALRSRGGVPERAIGRLRVVARRRLARVHGLDLDDPRDRAAITDVLGDGPVDVLTRSTRPELDLASFTAVVTAVESVDDGARTTERKP